MIQLRDIEKSYTAEGVKIKALNTLSLTIDNGEFVAVMGPSGCGKSTLLNILGFLDEVDQGKYLFEDRDVTHLPARDRAALRKNLLGFVFQNFNLIEDLTVFENVELPMLYHPMKRTARKERALEMLDKVRVDRKSKAYPYELSGGEQQRVALARALVVRPKLILADEPTANLDNRQGQEILDLLSELHRNGSTIVIATHSYRDALHGDRLVRMSGVPI